MSLQIRTSKTPRIQLDNAYLDFSQNLRGYTGMSLQGVPVLYGPIQLHTHWLIIPIRIRMANQMTDDLLRQYVDGIFERYDIDHSNTLTLNELVVFFNDLIGSRGSKRLMSPQEVQQSLKAMDANNDGQITKKELFNALKKMNVQSNIFDNGDNIYPGFESMLPQKGKDDINDNYYTTPQSYDNQNLYHNARNQQRYNHDVNPVTPQSYQAQPYAAQRAAKRPNKARMQYPMMNTPLMGPSPYMSMGMPMGPMSPMGMGMPMGGMGMPMGGMGMNPFSNILSGIFGLGMFF